MHPSAVPTDEVVDFDKRGSVVVASEKFARAYGRINKKAYRGSQAGGKASGFLTEGVCVSVVDYGRTKQGESVHVCVEDKCCKTKEAFEALLKPHDDWDFWHRWIDIDGLNGQIIQHSLDMLGASEQVIFNMIVDPNQQSMVLDLDPESSDTKILLTSTKVMLTAGANKLLEDDEAKLYAPKRSRGDDKDEKEFDIVEHETVSYLCRISQDRKTGTLITVQSGVPDTIFDRMKKDITSHRAMENNRADVVWILMRLIRAASNSLYEVVNFLDQARSQLEQDLLPYRDRKDNRVWKDFGIHSHEFIKAGRSLETECEALLLRVKPLQATLETFSQGYKELMGATATAWRALAVQNRNLADRVATGEKASQRVVRLYKDIQAKRDNARQERIEQCQARTDRGQNVMGLVLGVFSPLSFLSGMYGMNFVKADGTPSIPELVYGFEFKDPSDPTSGVIQTGLSGYAYFWILIGCTVAVVLMVYMALGLIPTPKACCKMLCKREDDESDDDDDCKKSDPAEVVTVKEPKL